MFAEQRDMKVPPELVPRCPVCGQECETVYKTKDYEIVGCDLCLRPVDAWECSECFPHYERSYPDD